MAYVSIAGGLTFPFTIQSSVVTSGAAVIDAATEKIAMIGRVYMEGRTTSTKTLSTGTIQFRVGTATFANGATTLDIGIQDVATGAGPIAQPDGTFDVKGTLTGGAGITANAWNTATMNTGTKNITHGDLIAVVFDMTARGGVDTVTVAVASTLSVLTNNNTTLPVTNAFISSAWQTTLAAGAGRCPDVVIVCDDGTLATLDGSCPFSISATETFQDSTNPDERGLIFTMPFDCKIDALWAWAGSTDANGDFTISLYENATTAANSLVGVSVLAEQGGVAATNGMLSVQLATEIELAAGTEYCVAIRATGSNTARLFNLTLGDNTHRVFYPGGTSLSKGTRDGGSGNFTAASTIILNYMGIRISQIDDGTGTGAATTGKFIGG